MFKFNQTKRTSLSFFVVAAAIAFTNISWTDSYIHCAAINAVDDPQELRVQRDTVPEKSLEGHLRELRRAQERLQHDIAGKDWNRIEAEMENALARINAKEVENQVERAMQQLDKQMNKLDKQELMENLQLEKLQERIAEATDKVTRELNKKDWEKEMRSAVNAMKKATVEMSKVDAAAIRAELNRVRENMGAQTERLKLEIDKARDEMRENKGTIKNSLEQAAGNLKRVEAEMEGYRTMIDQMVKAGLIKDRNNYQIEFRKNELTIDGQVQPASIRDKYKKYFPHDTTRLINKNNEFDIRTDTVD